MRSLASEACSCTQYALQEPKISAFFSSLDSHAVGVMHVLSAPQGSLSCAAMEDIIACAEVEVRGRASVCHNEDARCNKGTRAYLSPAGGRVWVDGSFQWV